MPQRAPSRRIVVGLALTLLITTLWLPPARGVHAQEPFAAIDAYVAAALAADRVPGAALVIVQGDRVVHARSFGTDGAGRPVTPATPFLLGSMSKSFTALLVLQLVEQGKLDLDAPVQRYLPWFRVADPQAAAQITIRHLLHHTSGIPERAPRGPAGSSLTAQSQALATVALNHPPGSAHEYASPNYIVLGNVLEAVSGVTYAELLQSQVFAPLQLRQSFTAQDEALQHGMSQGHRYWFGFPVAVTLPYEADRMPTAAVIASAEDLGSYLIAQLSQGAANGQRLLSSELMALMHKPAVTVEPGLEYAMGWRVSRIGGAQAVHHGGVLPHMRGKMVMLPEAGWGVVVLTNASTILPVLPTSHRIADAVAASLAGEALPDPGSAFQLITGVIALGMALGVLSAVRSMLGLPAWRRQLRTRPAGKALAEALTELLLPIGVVVGLVLALRLPVEEFFRAAPDIAWWTSLMLGVGVLVGVVKLVSVLHRRPG